LAQNKEPGLSEERPVEFEMERRLK
jgi:hypothetical protein